MIQRIPLTARQRLVFEFLCDYIAAHHIAPTFDEMAQHFGRTLGTLHEIVAQIERRGWIRRIGEPKSQRNIAIVPDNDVAVGVANALEHDAVVLDQLVAGVRSRGAKLVARAMARRLRDYTRTLRSI